MDNLILVNKENTLPHTYMPKKLVQDLVTQIWITKETYTAFYNMNIGIQIAGFSSFILVSGYRSYLYQEKLFKKKVEALVREGLNQADATEKASTIVAKPGTSEHQTGLAIDITSNQLIGKQDPLIEAFGETNHGKWLDLYAHEYGFILRYSKEKSHITHVSYEPWHYRYVGPSHAKKIKAAGVCLEEYKACLDKS